MRALRLDQPAALVGAAGADDGEPRRARDLHSGHAHAAGCAVNEHDVAGHGPGALEQGAIRGGVGNIDGRAFRVMQPISVFQSLRTCRRRP